MKKLIPLLLITSVLLLIPGIAAADPPNPVRQPDNNSLYGMDILGPGWQWTFPREYVYPRPRLEGPLRIDHADEAIRLAWAAGVRSSRIAAWWCFLEPEEDEYNWEDLDIMIQLTSNYGLEPVPEILYTPHWARADAPPPRTNCINNWRRNYPPTDKADWAEFMAEIVKRYGYQGKNQVEYWEIWNEPDLPEFLSTTNADGRKIDVYADLLKIASQQVRGNDPRAKVLLGGLSDIGGPSFLSELLDLEAPRYVRDDFDIIPFHVFSNHRAKLDLITWPLEDRDLSYELWINELNKSSWGSDYDRAEREIERIFDEIDLYDVTRTFWFKSYTTKWGPGIFFNQDPIWEIKPWRKSPFYDTFLQQSFPRQLPGTPIINWPHNGALRTPRTTYIWTRPTRGSYDIVGYKFQVDDSLYQGNPYFHSPEIDDYVPGNHLHFLPMQIEASRNVGQFNAPTAGNAPAAQPSIKQVKYKPIKALKPGIYYWRVAAVDSEGNVGPYSEPRVIVIGVGGQRTYLPLQTR